MPSGLANRRQDHLARRDEGLEFLLELAGEISSLDRQRLSDHENSGTSVIEHKSDRGCFRVPQGVRLLKRQTARRALAIPIFACLRVAC